MAHFLGSTGNLTSQDNVRLTLQAVLPEQMPIMGINNEYCVSVYNQAKEHHFRCVSFRPNTRAAEDALEQASWCEFESYCERDLPALTQLGQSKSLRLSTCMWRCDGLDDFFEACPLALEKQWQAVSPAPDGRVRLLVIGLLSTRCRGTPATTK